MTVMIVERESLGLYPVKESKVGFDKERWEVASSEQEREKRIEEVGG